MADRSAPPRSAGVLEKLVRQYVRERGLAERRVRDWVSYMALVGALENSARAAGGEPHFTVRGGVAMELRLKGLARATKDIDLTYSGPDKDHVAALDDALRGGYGDFTFRRTGEPYRMSRAQTARVEIAVSYKGQTWGSVTVDIGEVEGHRLEIEMVPGFDLREFGIEGPANLACLSARYHLAHKIHGMTSPGRDGLQNDRIQDAVDALLLSELVTDLTAAHEACVEVFRVRDTHTWPPKFEPPEGAWEAPYARMAGDLKHQPDNLRAASTRLRELIAAIMALRLRTLHPPSGKHPFTLPS